MLKATRPLQRFVHGAQSRASDLVVATGRSLVVARAVHGFPLREQQLRLVEAPEDRIHGPALQPRSVHHVEPVPNASAHGEQYDGGGVGDANGHPASRYVRVYIG